MTFFENTRTIQIVLAVGLICLLGFAACSDRPTSTETAVAKGLSADWPHSNRGWPAIYGPHQDSISRESGIETRWSESGPPVQWRRKIGAGYSTPIAVDDRAFALYRQGDEEILECLDTATGELRWDFRRPTTFVCGWESYSSGPYSTPVASERHIFFVSSQGTMYCLARDNGQLIWERNLFADYQLKDQKWPVVASPALTSDRLIFNLGASELSAGIIALDPADGSTIWQATEDAASHCSPLVTNMHGRKLAFVLTAQSLVCLDPSDGTVFWKTPHKMSVADAMFGNAVTPIQVDNKIVIVSGPHVRPGFRCLSVNSDLTFSEPWSNIRLLNTQYTNLIAHGDYVFGMKGAGAEMRCVDIRAGKLAWKSALKIGRANGISVGDAILLLGERGHLAAIEINSQRLVVRSQSAESVLQGPCYSPMALNDGLLYLRNEQEIICLNLRQYPDSPPIDSINRTVSLDRADANLP